VRINDEQADIWMFVLIGIKMRGESFCITFFFLLQKKYQFILKRENSILVNPNKISSSTNKMLFLKIFTPNIVQMKIY
jgi:hypothetical protein